MTPIYPHGTHRRLMKTETEIIVLPYDAALRTSLAERLVAELKSSNWTRFRAAIAFAKTSGNYETLLTALSEFAEEGNQITLTFGADTFGKNTKGSDFEALQTLITRLGDYPKVFIHLYHEKNRTFHPKIYLFDSEESKRALLIIGSSNWSQGGMLTNVEASALIHLDLSDEEHLTTFEKMEFYFNEYWSEL
jgi:HKD family nuclease